MLNVYSLPAVHHPVKETLPLHLKFLANRVARNTVIYQGSSETSRNHGGCFNQSLSDSKLVVEVSAEAERTNK